MRRALATAGHADQWLDGLELRVEDCDLYVTFIHKYFERWFQTSLRATFENLLAQTFPAAGFKIFYAMDKGGNRIAPHVTALTPHQTPHDTFANFHYNDKNELVVAAAREMAKGGGAQAFSLVLCGSHGTGKSHLLRAIAHAATEAQRRPGIELATRFCGRMLERGAGVAPAHAEDRPLILDDLRDLADQPACLNFLADYIDRQRETGSPDAGLVLGFSGSPGELSCLGERLRSRLESGLILELRPPDLEVRIRFLENFHGQKLALRREELLFLARRGATFPTLLGLLRKVEFFTRQRGSMPSQRDLEFLASAGDYASPPDWREILALVGRRLNLKADEILSPSRKPDYVLARQVAMHLCRRRLGLSYQELGNIFGGRDHSTAMHAVRKIRERAARDKNTHILLENLENSVSQMS